VNADRREVAFLQQRVELRGASDRLDKDTDLVELEIVEEVVELAVLVLFLELQEVLLQTVQRELGLVVDVDFEGLCGQLESGLRKPQ
jgi:hypothetical protein